MTDSLTPEKAEVKTSKRISRAWLLPLLAIMIGGWILYQHYNNQGALIQIEFLRATGLEAGKTKIRTRDLEVGVVKSISLKDDLSGVIVTARMAPDTHNLLGKDSHFWIVTPRVSLDGIEGLGTLLSGSYIEISPPSEASDQTKFVALEKAPVTPPGTPGLHITLNSNDEFAFKEGDPIIYKGLQVGEFEDIYFNLDERIVYYNAFIKAPYHELITTNTKFWNVSGVSFNLDANGVSVKTASLATLLTNGVTFGIPEGIPAGDVITKRSFFDIYPNYETALEERYKLGAEFVIMIGDTIRGLQVGAPVEYRGIEVGKVLAIDPQQQSNTINFDEIQNALSDKSYIIPVLITIQPGRINLPDTEQSVAFFKEQFLRWINVGLRASLKVGNVLTGALYVDLQHYPDAEKAKPEQFEGYDVIPTIPGEFAQITDKVNDLLNKLNQLPLEQMMVQINTTLKGFDETAASMKATSAEFNQLATDIQQQGLPDNLNTLLKDADQLLKDYSAGSATNEEVNHTLQSLQQTLNALQPLVQQLNKSPNSLIFNRGSADEPEPKAR